jgi:hypothetical protein
MRKASSVFQFGVLKLAQNYIPAKKIIAWSSELGRRRGCWQGVFGWRQGCGVEQGLGWSRALGPAGERLKMIRALAPEVLPFQETAALWLFRRMIE